MNIKRFTQSKNKLFLSWLTSYALVLIIPILIGSFAYVKSIETISNEVNKAHNSSLNQLKSVIDNKLEDIYRLNSDVLLDQKIKNLMYDNVSFEANDLININEIQKDLSKFKLSNSFIDNLYVYVKNNNYLLDCLGKYGEDELNDISEKNLGISSKEFMKLVKTNQFKNFIIIRQDKGNGKYINKVIFIQSLYLSDFASPTGAFIVVIDGKKITDLLQQLQWSPQGKTLLIDNRNKLIGAGNVESLPQDLLYENIKLEDKVFYKNIFGENTAVTHVKSNVVDWEYVSLIPTKIYLKNVQGIKQMVIAYVVICLLLGSCIAFLFAKRNYSPVKKLTLMFINRLGKSIEGKYSEFSFLENSIRTVLEENDSFITRFKQQNEAMRNNLLVRIMKGRVRTLESITDFLHSYEIYFKSDKYLVMIFSLDELSKKIFDDNARENEDTMLLINFIITNVVEELICEKHRGYMVDIDGMLACLVNVDVNDKEKVTIVDIDEEIKQISHKAIEFIQNRFGISLSVAISDVQPEFVKIGKAYSEALEVIEYKTLIEISEKVIHYSSIDPTGRKSLYSNCSLEKEKQFINSIMTGDYKSARCILNDIIANDFMKDVQSLPVAKCRMFGLINSMLNAVGEIMTELDIEFFNELDPANRLLKTKSINELKKQADEIFGRIAEYYANKNKEQIPCWIFEVEDYVKDHYYETDLSISGISTQLNINNSYLSRTYKKYRGYGLLDFIHKMRLEKAKQLLKTELSISDIAERVGYLNDKAMISAFKRYEGITPGRFRENDDTE